jgi:DNA-binding beta-propeller fold protein YncE
MKHARIATLATVVIGLSVPFALRAADQAPLYRLAASVPLGAPERWDYVSFDPTGNRVYVAHGDRLSVVDAGKNSVVGQVGTFPGGTHGSVALPDLHVAYTDDGEAGVAIAFDPATLKVLKRIPAATDADGIVYDPVSRHVFIIEGDSGTITVIDPHRTARLQR